MIAGPTDQRWAPPGDWKQITIFLSPMDVHINRTPVDGRITRIEYRPGKFLPGLQRRLERQRAERDLDRLTTASTVVVRQVVGILARRIVCRVVEGQELERGERIGLMKFGSRMDVFLPTGRRAARRGRRARRRRRDGAGRVRERRCSITSARGGGPTARAGSGAASSCCRRCSPSRTCSAATPASSTRRARDFDTAALLIGIAMVLDTLDGFFARLTNSSSAFGVAARFARRRRVVRPGAGDPRVHVGAVAAASGSGGRRASSTSPPRRCAWRASTSRPTQPERQALLRRACRARRRPA